MLGAFDTFAQEVGSISMLREELVADISSDKDFTGTLSRLKSVIEDDDSFLDKEDAEAASEAFNDGFIFGLGMMLVYYSELGDGVSEFNLKYTLKQTDAMCEDLLSGRYRAVFDSATPADIIIATSKLGFRQMPGYEEYMNENMNAIHPHIKNHAHSLAGTGLAANIMVGVRYLDIEDEMREEVPMTDREWNMGINHLYSEDDL